MHYFSAFPVVKSSSLFIPKISLELGMITERSDHFKILIFTWIGYMCVETIGGAKWRNKYIKNKNLPNPLLVAYLTTFEFLINSAVSHGRYTSPNELKFWEWSTLMGPYLQGKRWNSTSWALRGDWFLQNLYRGFVLLVLCCCLRLDIVVFVCWIIPVIQCSRFYDFLMMESNFG